MSKTIDLEAEKAKRLAEAREKSRRVGWFKASLLAPLRPFINYCRLHEIDPVFVKGEVQIEPHPVRGVNIMAFGARAAMGVVHDPDGFVSGPMQVLFPDPILDACEPTPPLHFTREGWCYDHAVPEWMQPGQVLISEAGCDVLTAMPHPSNPETGVLSMAGRIVDMDREPIRTGSSLIIGREPIVKDWRSIFRTSAQSGCQRNGPFFLQASPQVLALFEGPMHHFEAYAATPEERESARSVTFSVGKDNGPILVSLGKVKNFIGVLMPQKANKIHLPDFWEAEPERGAET